MKKFYPGLRDNHVIAHYLRAAVLSVVLLLTTFFMAANGQGLVFSNATLVSGIAGQDGAVYRFPDVTTNVDALVTINGRSSPLVGLVSIDLTNTGFQKAFQPQVTYNNNTTPDCVSDWWMEFSIAFVAKNTTTLIKVDSFNLTGLDIDGNNDKINEWVGFYSPKSYTFEANTQLSYENIFEMLSGSSTLVGKKFNGPVFNYVDIDTTATRVMVTCQYENINAFRLRTGGHSTGVSGAADRMYSFWFKSFNYQDAVQARLPVKLESFTVTLQKTKPVLQWVAAAELNLNYYLVQRSTDGINFNDAGYVFSNPDIHNNVKYEFPDNPVSSKGVLYYRLKMVDMDGRAEFSETRLLRVGAETGSTQIQAYPNPVQNELRITIPTGWQYKKIQYDIISSNGQLMKQFTRNLANQTEALDVSRLPEGIYLVRVSSPDEQSVQRFIKRQ